MEDQTQTSPLETQAHRHNHNKTVHIATIWVMPTCASVFSFGVPRNDEVCQRDHGGDPHIRIFKLNLMSTAVLMESVNLQTGRSIGCGHPHVVKNFSSHANVFVSFTFPQLVKEKSLRRSTSQKEASEPPRPCWTHRSLQIPHSLCRVRLLFFFFFAPSRFLWSITYWNAHRLDTITLPHICFPYHIVVMCI